MPSYGPISSFPISALPAVTATPAVTVNEDSWHQGWGTPSRSKVAKLAAVVVMASGLFGPPLLRAECAFQWDTFQTDAFQVCPQGYEYGNWSVPAPKRNKAALYASSGVVYPPYVAQAEIVTVDKWFEPLSERLRKKTILTAAQDTTALPETPTVSYSWFQPISTPKPPPKKTILVGQQDFFEAPQNPTVSFSWYQPFETPVLKKRALQSDYLSAPYVAQAEVVTVDKWYQPFENPRKKLGLLTGDQDSFEVPSNPTVSFGWNEPFSEPVRQKPGLKTHLQSTVTIDPFILTQPEFVSEDKWHQKWPDSARGRKFHPSLNDGYSFSPYFFPPEVVTVDKWFRPLEGPVRTKIGLKAHLQQFLAFVKADPFPETTTVDRYWRPFSEPKRFKPGLNTALQPFYADSPYNIPAEIVTVDKWYAPFSERLRAKRGLQATQQDAFTAPETPTVSFSWYSGLSEPKRFKAGLRASQQDAFAVPETPTVSFSWYAGLSEPKRFKKGLQATQQDASAAPENPVVSYSWFGNLSEPKRFKRRTAETWYADVPYNVPAEIVTVDKWYQWLSEPKRFKRGLAATLQQYTALVQAAPFGETVFEDKWHQPWSEPTRRRGIKVHQAEAQPFLFKPTIISHDVTLDATETPDVAAFVLSVSTSLAGANVSVVELVPQEANTGIITDATLSEASSITSYGQANVSIIEIPI